ncbi:uncharacterized protein Z518_03915 [Rhinocladiella mackenziei CBS 650.93]|uniref:Kinesin light chain n=1 Tax=Rhinocladiella mackenziei CBS 650.93 TaxID=1442369 RepID=A0A0D2IS31_9EURO|nr:uncharacterized protein Z518_03915 [Rhinocladiella mackenziei CBS 650.93]KIX05941.1 hypothetical protein Z518_03915 [Rhinocladiella mackenziei CBS 650.93]
MANWIQLGSDMAYAFLTMALSVDSIHCLVLLYADRGKLDEAEKIYQRALAGYEKALGTDHTSTLDRVNNLGLLYAKQGKLEEAETTYRRALQGFQKSLGADHPSIMTVMTNLQALQTPFGRDARPNSTQNAAPSTNDTRKKWWKFKKRS